MRLSRVHETGLRFRRLDSSQARTFVQQAKGGCEGSKADIRIRSPAGIGVRGQGPFQ
jgi:hypothetical protein